MQYIYLYNCTERKFGDCPDKTKLREEEEKKPRGKKKHVHFHRYC